MTRSHFQFRLYVLGTFRIEGNSAALHFPTRKHEALLAFLALHPQSHSRESLAALFWGDTPDEQARMSLRTALAALRRQLGDDLLMADREMVQLNPEFPLWVDAREIEQMANREWQMADGSSAVSDLESATNHYRGDLLSDFYDEWILQERERLRAWYHDALLALTQQARAASGYARALELAQKLLASDPSNEKAHQHAMFCYAAMGDRGAALKQYDDCRRALREELNVAPSQETTALYEQIRAQATGAPAREALFTNLPVPLTSFVGREKELGELQELVRKTRWITLTGAGGCGKTRLAIQAATDLAAAGRFHDGVWWVDLSALSDPSLVTQTVAQVFNLTETPAMPLIALLTNYLRAREALLVLDNCEHLLGACAQLIGTLSSACPKLQILATSREAVSISGETIWRVPSLALPDPEHLPPLAQLRRYDAIQLFAERALAVENKWRLAENAAPTAQICARLDGIPLAIELAAAQLANSPVQQIAARLDDRFNLLAGGTRADLSRHQTLRAAMDWSYDLLSDAERSLLRRLSVFAGGFTLEAVEAVCAGEQGSAGAGDNSPLPLCSPAPLLDLLTSLIDKSLVLVETRGNAARYRLLETIRQYAREKSNEAGEADPTRLRHRDYFCAWIEQAAPHLRRADAVEWRDRIEWDYDNLRAAWEHVTESSPHIGLRIAWALKQYWSWRGLVPEGLAWLSRLLPIAETLGVTCARARMLTLNAFLLRTQWNIPAALQSASQAIEVARRAGEPRDLGFALQEAGYLHQFPIPPNCVLAVEYLEESRKIFEMLGDDSMREWTDTIQGMAIAGTGDVARGMAQMQASLERCRASGDKLGMLDAVGGLGYITLIIGDYPSAAHYNGEAVALGHELRIAIEFVQMLTLFTACVIKLGDYRQGLPRAEEVMRLYHDQASIPGIVIGLEMIGMCLAASKQFEPAVRLFGNVEREREAKRSTTFVVPDFFAPEWANVRAQMGAAAYEKANAEGRAMELERAYDYALEQVKNL